MKMILVADDEHLMRQMMAENLKQAGHRVLEAADGLSAVQIAHTQHPDVIVCDVRLENMNGFMVREAVRNDPACKDIPFIMVTGVAESAGAWGADPDTKYLAKPFTAQQLVDLVSECLAQERSG